jgi:hypothetical protein
MELEHIFAARQSKPLRSGPRQWRLSNANGRGDGRADLAKAIINFENNHEHAIGVIGRVKVCVAHVVNIALNSSHELKMYNQCVTVPSPQQQHHTRDSDSAAAETQTSVSSFKMNGNQEKCNTLTCSKLIDIVHTTRLNTAKRQ